MIEHEFAVITPCFRESEATLSRMMESVIAQAEPCHHVIVADGAPRYFSADIYNAYSARGHQLTLIELPAGLANSGAGPRALGAAYALSQGAQWVSFLDADNAVTPHHLITIKGMALKGVAAVVTQRRVFLKDTGEETPREKQEHQGIHIDTNCLVLSNRCADLLVLWSHWPRAFGTGEDRIFSAILNATGKPIAFTTEATVLYWSEWPIHYSLANKPVPKTAKKPTRRAATHFHASSFFDVVGQWPIAMSWRKVNARPIPRNTGPALVCQYVANCDSADLKVGLYTQHAPVCFSDVFVTHSTRGAGVPWLLDNQSVLTLPTDAEETYGLASMATVAFHLGHKHLLWLTSLALKRSHDLDSRLRALEKTLDYRGVTCIYRADGSGDKLIAIVVTTDLGPILNRLACWSGLGQGDVRTDTRKINYLSTDNSETGVQEPPPELPIVGVMAALCKGANVPFKRLRLL